MTPEDQTALKRAVQALEHPSFAARLANMVGKPIELIEHALPSFAADAISAAARKGLEAAMQVALRTLQRDPYAGSQTLHKILATASGAAGGAFGLATLPIELPISTVIILRSIMDRVGRRIRERIFGRPGRTGEKRDGRRRLHF
jgi:hypothetical protein